MKEIRAGRAPRKAVAPERIPSDSLYKLDVDDPIWQDVGLGDDEDTNRDPPPWLCDDDVRSGIRAMLQLERTEEEDVILKKERRSMRIWFIEEWKILNAAMGDAGTCFFDGATLRPLIVCTLDGEEDRYQFYLRRERLVRLCATWRKYIPDAEGDAAWGPTEEELVACLIQRRTSARGEDGFDAGHDTDNGEELEDFETLDALDNADVYCELYNRMDGDSTDDGSTDDGSESD
ncbi:hypothetical protein B0H19DRAFT_935048 [Mycena capillaripes]|nr:hypothetical protein B0H19DRAFT_935048 [Mycena capillaripes]